jgi:hypothetical protein
VKNRDFSQLRAKVAIVAGALLLVGLSGCADSASVGGDQESVLIQFFTHLDRKMVYKVEVSGGDWDHWCEFKHSHEGARVTISDSANNVVGVATLGKPNARGVSTEEESIYYIVSGVCVTTLRVSINSDSDFFTIEVQGVAGSVTYTREELLASVELTVP